MAPDDAQGDGIEEDGRGAGAATRLADSPLWRLQRAWFERAGIDAWRSGTVPHYVTCNPRLASAYAAVLLGFLRDSAAAGEEPATIVELGAGSGRFGFLLVKALLDLRARSPWPELRFRYVLTDVAEATLAFWRAHPQLQPWFASGVLDLGRFDAVRDSELHLEHAGVTLRPGAGSAPLAVVANYVFDGLPQDAFLVRGGRLRHWLLELRAPPPGAEPAEADALAGLDPVWHAAPLAGPPYPEPAFNEALAHYARTLADTVLLFPCAALRCLERLAALGGGPLLLLSGDRGETGAAALDGRDSPGLARHGSVSLPVNYHALARHAERLGGAALTGAHRHAGLALCAVLLGTGGARFAETRYAWELAVEHARPDDFFHLRRGVQEHYEALDAGRMLALLRLSHWDPRVLDRLAPHLWERLDALDPPDRAELAASITRAAANHFHIGEETDVAHAAGLLLHALGAYAEALDLFDLSLKRHGDDPRTYWNMGLCAYALGRSDDAAALFAAARLAAPDFVPVGALQGK